MADPHIPPQTGEKAPFFPLLNAEGVYVNPADFLGRYVIIYFYPKALTSGCTVQACAIRDHRKELADIGVVVFGISPDEPKLLKKFKEKEGLDFELLSDADHRMAQAYDTWKQKSMYGRSYMGMMRDTYVVEPRGTIIQVLHKVSPSTHLGEIMAIVSQHIRENTKN